MNDILKKLSLFLILIGFFWIAAYGAFSISVISAKPKNVSASSDAIIVLTGGNYRVKTGFDLWAQKYAPYLFITGVHPTVSLLSLIDEWKKTSDLTLPVCCAAIGQNATTTIQNAQETSLWIQKMRAVGPNIQTVHLVTSTYHMPRALMEFRQALPNLKIIPRHVTEDDYRPTERRFWRITASELNKILFRKAFFFIEDFKTALIQPIARKR